MKKQTEKRNKNNKNLRGKPWSSMKKKRKGRGEKSCKRKGNGETRIRELGCKNGKAEREKVREIMKKRGKQRKITKQRGRRNFLDKVVKLKIEKLRKAKREGREILRKKKRTMENWELGKS